MATAITLISCGTVFLILQAISYLGSGGNIDFFVNVHSSGQFFFDLIGFFTYNLVGLGGLTLLIIGAILLKKAKRRKEVGEYPKAECIQPNVQRAKPQSDASNLESNTVENKHENFLSILSHKKTKAVILSTGAALLIIAIIVFLISAYACSTALTHYEDTLHITTIYEGKVYRYNVGCGKYSCDYCNGLALESRHFGSSLNLHEICKFSFSYYNDVTLIKDFSMICSIVCAIFLALYLGVIYFKKIKILFVKLTGYFFTNSSHNPNENIPQTAPQITPDVKEKRPLNFCKYCGTKIDSDSVFCSYCGRKIV